MTCEEIVREGYNAIARQYLASRTGDSEDVSLLGELADRLPRGAKVLDAGCGAGVPVTRVLSQFFEVTGVDFAESQLQLARELVPGASFLLKDMRELDFADSSFDAICSYYALIHVPRESHAPILRNFYRMLRPSGVVLLCMGSSDVEEEVSTNYYGVPMYWSHYDADTNVKMVEACGFTVIWSRIVVDSTYPQSNHLFVLAQKCK